MYELKRFTQCRFVGIPRGKWVVDREGLSCSYMFLREQRGSGPLIGFTPDTLEQAESEGFRLLGESAEAGGVVAWSPPPPSRLTGRDAKEPTLDGEVAA